MGRKSSGRLRPTFWMTMPAGNTAKPTMTGWGIGEGHGTLDVVQLSVMRIVVPVDCLWSWLAVSPRRREPAAIQADQ
jgi:hypothetical protein